MQASSRIGHDPLITFLPVGLGRRTITFHLIWLISLFMQTYMMLVVMLIQSILQHHPQRSYSHTAASLSRQFLKIRQRDGH